MKLAFGLSIILILVITTLFLQLSCRKEVDTLAFSVQKTKFEDKKLPPIEESHYTKAMVIFLSGKVLALRGEEWQPLEIGDLVEAQDIVRTVGNSYCELQFGDVSCLRLQANTEILLKDVFLEPDKSVVNIKLVAGAILARVSSLTGSQKFTVQSPFAVCGVRGTVFCLQVTPEGNTRLAVKEGQVAVLPASADLASLQEKVRDSRLLEEVRKIEKAAPLVCANQELLLGEETLKGSQEAFQYLVTTVETIDASIDNGKELSPMDLQELNWVIQQTNEALSEAVTTPLEIPQQSVRILQKIE